MLGSILFGVISILRQISQKIIGPDRTDTTGAKLKTWNRYNLAQYVISWSNRGGCAIPTPFHSILFRRIIGCVQDRPTSSSTWRGGTVNSSSGVGPFRGVVWDRRLSGTDPRLRRAMQDPVSSEQPPTDTGTVQKIPLTSDQEPSHFISSRGTHYTSYRMCAGTRSSPGKRKPTSQQGHTTALLGYRQCAGSRSSAGRRYPTHRAPYNASIETGSTHVRREEPSPVQCSRRRGRPLTVWSARAGGPGGHCHTGQGGGSRPALQWKVASWNRPRPEGHPPPPNSHGNPSLPAASTRTPAVGHLAPSLLPWVFHTTAALQWRSLGSHRATAHPAGDLRLCSD